MANHVNINKPDGKKELPLNQPFTRTNIELSVPIPGMLDALRVINLSRCWQF